MSSTQQAIVPMPRAAPRKGLVRSTLALAAAGAVAAMAYLSSRGHAVDAGWAPTASWRHQPATVVLFVAPSCGQTRASNIARFAGSENVPGGRPKEDGEVALEAPEEKKEKLRPGEETLEFQNARVARQAKLLKSLQGKFWPVGPKPWDTHQFTKVCIQVRLKAKQAANTKIINQVVEELRRISGMHPKVVKAKHNVANYGWRVGYPCGVAVTLTGRNMHDFLNRLNMVVLPRVRDFEGLFPSSFDYYGNFWFGLQNQEPFKELDAMIDERVLVHGFDIGIINNCLTQPDGLALMKNFGFPFGEPRPRKAPKKKVSYQKMRPDNARR